MKKIAIIQSNYVPWLGYFDIINSVDEFVLYDDAQYTRRDWRNRNKIKTPQGALWLTIPIKKPDTRNMKINQAEAADDKWARKHWKTISRNYKKAKYFSDYAPLFEKAFLDLDKTYLSDINYHFISLINQILHIQTPIKFSSQYELNGDKSEKLLNICLQSGADHYLSGPAAKDYLDVKLFSKNGVQVEWADYRGYREYGQLYPPFDLNVSVIDLIFNEGPKAPSYLKSD